MRPENARRLLAVAGLDQVEHFEVLPIAVGSLRIRPIRPVLHQASQAIDALKRFQVEPIP